MKIPLFIQHTVIYGVSITLMRSVSLLMLPITAHYLSMDEFGILELLSTIAILGSVVVGLGLEDALFRFAGHCKSLPEKKRVAANIFTLTLIIGVLVSLLIYPLSHVIVAFIPGQPSVYAVQLVLMILALEGIIAVPLGWLRMRDKAVVFFLLTTGRTLLQAVFVCLFLVAGKGVEGVLQAGLIAALAQAIGLCYFQIKDTGFHINLKRSKKVIVYSIPLVGSGLLAFGLNGFDRVVIAELISLEQVALYSVAAKFSIAITILMQPFGMWWMPKRFTILNESAGEEKFLYFSVMGITLVILLMLTMGILSPLVLSYIMPEEYMAAIHYLLGLLIVVALKELTEFINIGCLRGDRTYTQLWINLSVTVIAVVAIIISVKQYQVWGVIGSLIVAHSLRLALFYIYSQKNIYLTYPLKKIILLFFSAIALLLIITADNNSFINILLTLSLSGFISLLIYQLYRESPIKVKGYHAITE